MNEPPLTDTPQARRYNRISRRLGLADVGIGAALMLVLLLTNLTLDIRDFSYRLAGGENFVLALLIYVFVLALIGKLLGFGLDYYSFRLEHEYHLSNQRWRGWIWDQFKAFWVGFGISIMLAELLYFAIRKAPQVWWIAAWISFMVLYVIFAQVAPVVLFPIFYKYQTLNNDELCERLTRLSEKAGTRVRGVYEWMLSEKSKKANAALMGLGVTQRIVLSDTLLANYSNDEIEAVLAHELGHHYHRHILKSFAVQAVITFIGFWALKIVLRWSVINRNWFISQYDFANLPLVILLTTVLSVVLMPVLNAYSRWNERQADRYAWKSIPSVEPFISAMNKLAEQNLAEREPSRWVEILFHSHPSIAKRIAAARAWQSRHPQPESMR